MPVKGLHVCVCCLVTRKVQCFVPASYATLQEKNAVVLDFAVNVEATPIAMLEKDGTTDAKQFEPDAL